MYTAHDILDIDDHQKDEHLEASWWYKFRQRRRGEGAAALRQARVDRRLPSRPWPGSGPRSRASAMNCAGAQGVVGGQSVRRDAREHDPPTPQVERGDDRRQGTRGDPRTGSRGRPERREKHFAYGLSTSWPRTRRTTRATSPSSRRALNLVRSPGPYRGDPLSRGMRPTFYHLLEFGNGGEELFDHAPAYRQPGP